MSVTHIDRKQSPEAVLRWAEEHLPQMRGLLVGFVDGDGVVWVHKSAFFTRDLCFLGYEVQARVLAHLEASREPPAEDS